MHVSKCFLPPFSRERRKVYVSAPPFAFRRAVEYSTKEPSRSAFLFLPDVAGNRWEERRLRDDVASESREGEGVGERA